jgi:hypothetical protein
VREVKVKEQKFYYIRKDVQIVERNRRASNHRSPLARIPLEKLCSGRGDLLVYQERVATSSPKRIRSLLP